MAEQKTYNVLFLCKGNSGRSIMAEAILNRLGRGKFAAFSAGSVPAGEVNPSTLLVLKQQNFSTDGLRSKSWNEFAGPGATEMDFVITLSETTAQSEVTPTWPGDPMQAIWPVPDPAAFDGTDAEKALHYRDVFGRLYNRISIFAELPFERLDRLALQTHLRNIGGDQNAAQPAA